MQLKSRVSQKIIIASVMASVLIMQPVVASAYVDQNNSHTGQDSVNTNTTTTIVSISYKGTSTADVTNKVNLDISTGGNDIKGNTSVGHVTSGEINTSMYIETVANVGSVSLSSTTTDQTVVSTNYNTGQGSKNTNTHSTVVNRDASVVKTANVSNSVESRLDTGGLDITGNTSVGNVSSGSVISKTVIKNCVNTNTICTTHNTVTPPTPSNQSTGTTTTHTSSTITTIGGDKGGAIGTPIAGPVTITLASISSNAIPLATLAQAKTVTSGYFPAGSTHNIMEYILLIISLLAFFNRLFFTRKLPNSLIPL